MVYVLRPRGTHENVFWDTRQITKKPLNRGLFTNTTKYRGAVAKTTFA